MNQRSTGARV